MLNLQQLAGCISENNFANFSADFRIYLSPYLQKHPYNMATRFYARLSVNA